MLSINQALLYGILDLAYMRAEKAAQMLDQLIAGGVDIVQLRGKGRSIAQLSQLAEELSQIAEAAGVPFIINDHAQLARQFSLSGVHVGQDDEAIATVRSVVNRQIIVGKSTHSVQQAIAAQDEGADYIGFGPLFATPTKPDYRPIGLTEIERVHQRVSIPIFCIGGIKLENLAEVLAAGATRVVIVSGVLQSPDPRAYANGAKQLLTARREKEHSTVKS